MGMSSEKEYDMMIKCAIMHYEEKMDQLKIASCLNISQSQVSKLLRKSRDEGLVKVEVTIQDPLFKDLERNIIEAFELKDARIVQSLDETYEDNERNIMKNIGTKVAIYFEENISDNKKIGISGGNTMYEFVNAVSVNVKNLKLYPLVAWGSQDFRINNMHASSLVAMWWFKNRNIEAYRLELPFHTGNTVWRAIRRIYSEIRSADFIVTSVGHMKEGATFSALVQSLEFDPKILIDEGIIGDFMGHPITDEGKGLERSKLDRVGFRSLVTLPMPLSTVAKLAKDPKRFVILAAGGEKKLNSVAAALRGRLFNVLITDVNVATALLEMRETGRL